MRLTGDDGAEEGSHAAAAGAGSARSAEPVTVAIRSPGTLDRLQIDRRVRVELPGAPNGVWVTSAEDQILRELDWYRLTDQSSERQWRDVIGIIRTQPGALDLTYLHATAEAVGLHDDLAHALAAAGEPTG